MSKCCQVASQKGTNFTISAKKLYYHRFCLLVVEEEKAMVLDDVIRNPDDLKECSNIYF